MPTLFVCTSCLNEYDNPGMCVDCDVELVPSEDAADTLDDIVEQEDRGFGFNGSDSYDDEDMI